MTLSVIIVTLNRPDCVRRCLECLKAQTRPPEQVIVVDASKDDLTLQTVAVFPNVGYLRNDLGLGHTTHSRNLGVQKATGDIIAFLDDDAYARPGWAAALLASYSSPEMGAVGGRVIRGIPDEELQGDYPIGRFTHNGEVLGFFSVDSVRPIPVDHLIGCNMSFRREVIARCGGFREGFTGPYCFREETDIFLVMRRLGYQVLFNPAAVVDHVAGPKPKGQRFDLRYAYYAERNQWVLLIRNFGLFSAVSMRYALNSGWCTLRAFLRRLGGAFLRLGAAVAGSAAGIAAGLVLRLRQGRDPVRRDAIGREISRVLSIPPASEQDVRQP